MGAAIFQNSGTLNVTGVVFSGKIAWLVVRVAHFAPFGLSMWDGRRTCRRDCAERSSCESARQLGRQILYDATLYRMPSGMLCLGILTI
jgi:hypothetical protein